ncbi:MAG TPA: VWA domain-containing protein [Candidatus Angelobacter sp.]|nr:VWA domain-containing protein [Candidatus Angelobacter sp.]
MRTLSTVFLTLSLALASPALPAGQEPLPSAPSATKYPAPPPAAPATQQPTAAPTPPPATTATPAQESTPQANPPATQANPAVEPTATKPTADQEEKLTTIVKQVDEVNVVFTVTDKRGKFVTDLKKDDFQVVDDKKPATIRSFRAETNLPLRVGLLIDASNSIRDRFKFEQDAAVEFLNQIVHLQDQAFVVGFDTTPEVTQNFTNNTESLAKGVRMLRPGGGTALYDAVYYAARDEIMAKDKSTIATRRAIILLSDGDDNQSRVSRDEAVEMAQKAEVIIYTISTNTSGMKLKGDKVLEFFAEKTGGRAFFPFKIADVSDAFSQIQDELRSQYAISYKPADLQPNGKYHTIQILADNKKYKVRAREGYYAPTH